MKITDPDIIKNGEKDLIDAVQEDLDLDVIKQILEKRITAAAMSSKGGQIIVHNNEIAFKLDFDLNLSGSLMFDREGNYIPETNHETDPKDPVDEDNMLDNDLDSDDLDSDDLDSEDFSLDDTPEETLEDEAEPDALEPEDLSDNLPDNIEDESIDDMDINLPEYDLDDELTPAEILEPLTDDPESEEEASEDDIIQDDMVHDDINDILKESQEFWDQKKDQ